MDRDHQKLRVFVQADALIAEVYRVTAAFPGEERYGLQAQIRRAAISAAANVVEGSARQSTRESLNFLNIANASTAEARYLIDVAHRLGLVREDVKNDLVERYTALTKGLQNLIAALHRMP